MGCHLLIDSNPHSVADDGFGVLVEAFMTIDLMSSFEGCRPSSEAIVSQVRPSALRQSKADS